MPINVINISLSFKLIDSKNELDLSCLKLNFIFQ